MQSPLPAWLLFAVLAAALLLFFGIVLVVAAVRVSRRAGGRRRSAGAPMDDVDPWREAGRRIRPYEPPPGS